MFFFFLNKQKILFIKKVIKKLLNFVLKKYKNKENKGDVATDIKLAVKNINLKD